MSLFLVNNNGTIENRANNIEKRSSKILTLIIPVIFIIGRLLSYNVFHIYSSYSNLPVNTLIWVFGFGLGISILYYLSLRSGLRGCSPFFISLIFGIYMFMFNFAYALIVNFTFDMYIDFFIRTGMDVLFAAIGVYVYEYLLQK